MSRATTVVGIKAVGNLSFLLVGSQQETTYEYGQVEGLVLLASGYWSVPFSKAVGPCKPIGQIPRPFLLREGTHVHLPLSFFFQATALWTGTRSRREPAAKFASARGRRSTGPRSETRYSSTARWRTWVSLGSI